MKKKLNFRSNGITLVALVITIIILLILAGITINLVLGEPGIFKAAVTAKEKYEISEYIDKVELSRIEATKYEGENIGKVFLDDLIEQIYKDNIVPRLLLVGRNNHKWKEKN